MGYQAPVHQPLIPSPQVVTTTEFTNYMNVNDAILKNMQTNMTSLTNSNLELKNMFGQFMKINTASSSGSGTLPSNTITNLKEDLKGIITRSGNAYQGPMVPTTSSSLPKVVERETEVKKDTVQPTNKGSNKDVQPLVFHIETPIPNSKPVAAPVSASKPNQKPSIHIYALILMPKFGPTIKSLLTNKDKLFELARTSLNEHCSTVLLNKLPEKLEDPGKFLIPCDFLGMDDCLALADLGTSINLMPLSVWNKLSLPKLTPTLMTLELADRSISQPIGVTKDAFQEVLGFSDVIASGNPTPYYDPIISTTSPTVTPFGDSDFLLKEVDAFLALEDDATLPENDKSSIDEPPEVELKDLPSHLEYVFLEGDDKLSIIIAKDLSIEEKVALIKVLKSHKQAIAWKLSDIKDIDLKFYTHKILMEDDFKPVVHHQRRVNPKIHNVIKRRRPFLRTRRALIYVYGEELTLRVDDEAITFKGGDFILEEIKACLTSKSIPPRIDNIDFDLEGDICPLEELLHNNPSSSPIHPKELNVEEIKTVKSSIDEPLKLELKDLSSHLEYAFLEGTDKLPVKISKELKDEEKFSLLKALKSHKWASTWKISDIKGIDARFCTYKILMENDFKPTVQHQRRVNLKIHEVIKKEVIKLLDAGLIYPISDSPWVSPIHCVPKKDGKNLAADHLSRLENPHQDELKKKEIIKTFPFETLGMIAFRSDSSTPCEGAPPNDARVVVKFLKSLFARFGTARAIISDHGTHFCNDQFAKVMLKYGVTHCLSTACHLQTSGQVEVLNRGLKHILERTIGENRASWSDKLDDALWALCTAFKTPIGCTPYKLVYGKACYLTIEL
uniref:Reverse transcriptase domain-containing protein n=1 Tax=Tanacetum cinerariifolium TaxID=118510 RepID=A0A6L2JW70_TANCI|nr:reverse transcriptase domain-containing protein [Tanacetum cinerariifolium]